MNSPAVLITGAATGIGRATVLAAAEAGYEILALDVQAGFESGLAARVHPVVVDLAEAEETRAAISAAVQGVRLHGVVNNAGLGVRKPFYELNVSEWDAVHAVNLRAPQLVTAAAWPALLKPGGSVVNVSSIHAAHALSGLAAYASSKAGIEGLTRAMALDAAEHGVRVNAVAPGFVHTRLWDGWLEELDEQTAAIEEAAVRAMIPLQRPAEPAEVADVILWLLSDRSSYVSGTTLHVDGGLGARASYRPGH